MKRYMKRGAICLTGLVMFGFPADSALAEEPSAEAAVGLYSKYVWRGFELSRDSLVVQPGLALGYQGMKLEFWANLDTNLHPELRSPDSGRFTVNETDITLAYDRSLGMVDLAAGYIYYSLEGEVDSQEVFLGAGLDIFLSPTLTVYREIAHAPGWYVHLAVSHAVPLSDSLDLELAAGIGYLDDTEDYGELHDGLISASITYPLTAYVSVTPELYYSFGLSSEARELIKAGSISEKSSFLYGGVSVSFAF